MINKIDYLEFYVFNAFQAANFYRSVLGFNIIAYGGPETGLKDKISYILVQEEIKLIISSTIDKQSPIIRHVLSHDDSIKDIAFLCDDTSSTFKECIKLGAIPVLPPQEINDGKEKIIKASIATFGDTVHSFIERHNDSEILPYYTKLPYMSSTKKVGLKSLDHLAIAIEKSTIKKWQNFYKKIFEFHLFYSEDIELGKSGMRSIVLANRKENIKLVFVEPISEKEKSQIETYINYNGGAGVQHIAFLSSDIIHSVKTLIKHGVKFLEVPASYYEGLNFPTNQEFNKENISSIRNLNILVDRDNDGYLMQVFSNPIQNSPTFFIEIIQRGKSKGFGSGNIRALYSALQKNQQIQGLIS